MKLVRNWHRLWSVWLAALSSALMAVLAAFPDVWSALPDEVRALLPERLQAVLPLALFVATLLARLVKQKDGRTDG